MRVGIDFDNTIVDYDALFHKVAVEAGLLPRDTTSTKTAVRDYLRQVGREDDWTELQGYVYGARMAEAIAFPGVLEFIRGGRATGLELYIVSHKTRYPFRGEKYDLHCAAYDWVAVHLCDERGGLIGEGNLFFELTKDAKIARIESLHCDYFVDDLPELLLAREFPKRTRRILFDPKGEYADDGVLTPLTSWFEIGQYLATAAG